LLLRSLAENIYDNVGSEDGVIIASDSLVEFFAKNIDICKEYLLARTTDEDIHIADNDLTVDIRWDYVVEEVAAAMTISSGRKNLFVCENDRSYQAGIDVALWAATVAAAIYSFGTGGVAIQGVKAGITQGAKNLVKIGVKKGVKTAAAESIATRVGADIAGKTAAKTAAADLAATTAANLAKKEAAAMAAKTAAETAARQALNQFNRHAGTVAARNALKSGGAKHISEKMLETELRKTAGSSAASAAAKKEAQDALDLLAKRQTAGAARKTAQQAYKTAAAETATGNAAQAANIAAAESALVAETAKATAALNRILAIFAISTPIAAAGGIAAAYSFLESGFDPKIMNCTDTDKNNGCYTSCTKDNLGSPNDDLNNKVFKPVFGKNLCVDENANYVLREIETGLPVPGQVFVATNEKLWERAKKIINDQVKDKGNCDYNEDDIDLYIGAPIYDPATLEPQAEGMALIIDGMRIDD
ncbi:MAG: hypothetical protein LBF28_02770, partial [Rickettsiales bacterium]|nr:hypothetical protein [Rickettsiales bacterium]